MNTMTQTTDDFADDFAIRIDDLFYEFQVGDPVLDGFQLEVPRGAICGLLGRNGCGKTTLLHCLLGLLEPELGRCQVLGLNPQVDTFELRRRVGYVPQTPLFEKGRTGEEHLDFVRPLYGERWNRQLEDEMVESFRLTLGLQVGAMSLGQQHQLSLVAALAYEPELLLLDEPTANLDAVIRRRFSEWLVEYMAKPGRTVLMASHMVTEMERLVDQVVVIARHRPLVAARLDDLKEFLLCLVARFPSPPPVLENTPNLLLEYRLGNTLQLAAWNRDGAAEGLTETLKGMGASSVQEVEPSLESLFVHLVGGLE
jgi:ABC-2 type transport system ATP-binding protein